MREPAAGARSGRTGRCASLELAQLQPLLHDRGLLQLLHERSRRQDIILDRCSNEGNRGVHVYEINEIVYRRAGNACNMGIQAIGFSSPAPFAIILLLGLTSSLFSPFVYARQNSQRDSCATALASEGTRLDGLAMTPMTWGGDTIDLDPIGGVPVTLCIANGPLLLLPATNGIGCLLVGGHLAFVEGKLACREFRAVSRRGADEVLWISNVSVLVSAVQPLRWSGTEFQAGEPYWECWDGARTDESFQCAIPR
ncbi:MAG: hypothetical protein HW416_665 [Chloroflexi bacterium]|nr:hypothetical protein [Chloroflexota bacterium]